MNVRVIVLLALVWIGAYASNVVSNFKGDLNVNNGALVYSVPFNLPAGKAGVKPALSLNYSSSTGSGRFGLGWSLSGLSAITRCGSSRVIDGNPRAVMNDNKDNVCLDGQRMQLVSEGKEKWESDTVYRPLVDNGSKLEYDGTKFTLYTKDGDIKSYEKKGVHWLLTRIVDRYGNGILYEYYTDRNEVFLKFIRYGATRIRFDYDYKKDQFHGYVNGEPYDVLRRARGIQIITGGESIRLYKLEYYDQDEQGRVPSRLYSITECAGTGGDDDACLNPLTFDMGDTASSYSELAGGRTLPQISSAYANSPETLNDMWLGMGASKKMNGAFEITEKTVNFTTIRDEPMFIDMNGDALPDLVGFKHDGVHIAYNNGDGTFSYSLHVKQFGTNEDVGTNELIPEDTGDWDVEKELRTVSDINADGRPDLVGFRWDGKLLVAYQTDQGGFDTAVEVATYYDAKECKTDIVQNCFKSTSTCLTELCNEKKAISCNDDQNSLGDACFAAQAGMFNGSQNGWIYWTDGWRHDKYLRMLSDMNGDSYPDIVTFIEDGVEVILNNKDGSFHAPVRFAEGFGYADMGKHPRTLADMDGDGLPDIVGFASDGVHIAYNGGDGTSFDYNATSIEPDMFGSNKGWDVSKHIRTIADVNGDGYNDFVGFFDEGVYVSLNKGDRSFQPAFRAVKGFGYQSDSYYVGAHPRTLADIDGNGLLDIVGFGDFGVNVAYNLGKTTADLVFSEPFVLINDFYRVNSRDQSVIDINGDGRADLVAFKDGELYSALQPERKSRMVGVTDSFENRLDIAYGYLTDKNMYTKGNIAKLPMRDITGIGTVVSQVKSPAPDGSISTIDYHYYGMRFHPDYGSLGFGRIDTTVSVGDVQTMTKSIFRQDYPYVGRPKSTETSVNGEKVSSSSMQWWNKPLDHNRSTFIMFKQIQTDYDLSIPIKESVTLRSNLDEYGNIRKIISTVTDRTTGDIFETTTLNTFLNSTNKCNFI